MRNKERLASLKHLGKEIIPIKKQLSISLAGNLLHKQIELTTKPKCENKA
jgi:hypothetical protein